MKNLLLAVLLTSASPAGIPHRYPDNDLVYGSKRSDIFRKHRVRTVLLEEQPLGPEYGPRPARLISREEIDPQGRVSSEETAENQPFLTQRREFEYSPAGVQVAQTKPDTARTPPAWLPVLHTRTEAEADQPAGATRWNRETGLWEPTDRVRTWTSHDTTYAETRTVAEGRRTLLTRTYYTGPGKQTMRFDVLPYTTSGLGEPQYQYYRFEHNNPVESGLVSYDKELAAHRPPNPISRGDDPHARREGLDQLARHSTGTYQPSGKATFTPQGQLLTMDIYEVLTTYQRDKQGRALSRRMGTKTQRNGRLTTYTYRPDGLLATETEAQENGPMLLSSHYRYQFY